MYRPDRFGRNDRHRGRRRAHHDVAIGERRLALLEGQHRGAQVRLELEQVSSGVFSPEQPDLYRELVDSLLAHDHFLVLSDFEAYPAKQAEVSMRWRHQSAWRRSAMLNIANVGWFSSDRAIREYAEDIWNVPVPKV